MLSPPLLQLWPQGVQTAHTVPREHQAQSTLAHLCWGKLTYLLFKVKINFSMKPSCQNGIAPIDVPFKHLQCSSIYNSSIHAHFHTINILNFTILFPSYTLNSSREEQFMDSYIRLSALNALIQIWSQFSSVAQSYQILCDPTDCSTPGLPVHHQPPKFTQTHVHWVGDAIQPSHSLSSPSPPAFNLSQHEGLFQWVSSLHQVAKVLEFQLQHQSFQWIFRTDLL